MLKGKQEHIKRANEELEDLLRQNFADATVDRLVGGQTDAGLVIERGAGDHEGPLLRLLSTHDSGAERLLGSTDDWHASTTSSARAGDPSLLGSGWSWQNPRGAHEFLSSSSLNNTADSETLRRKMSISSVRTGQTSDDTRWHGSGASGALAPPNIVERRPDSPASEGGRSQPSSRFSTDASESGDDWTASDDDDRGHAAEPIPYDSIIGRGAFGSVYRTTWKNRPAALKVIEHEDELGRDDGSGGESASEDELDSLARRAGSGDAAQLPGSSSLTATQADQALLEAAMSSAVHHPNVVQTYHYRTVQPSGSLGRGDGVGRAVRETHIVMEYCDGGSLEDAVSDGRLSDPEGADVDLELLGVTLLEVARAMEYLHKMHITHRDLKLANVLLKSAPGDARGFTAKVSDFGLSRLLPDQSPKFRSSSPEYTGTITHMAPELLEHGGMSRAADVYSFGILMWEALMGQPAYQGISKMQVMFGVVSEGLRPSFPPNTPAWYAQIATACWRRDPKRRPSFSKVCQKLAAQLSEMRAAISKGL